MTEHSDPVLILGRGIVVMQKEVQQRGWRGKR